MIAVPPLFISVLGPPASPDASLGQCAAPADGPQSFVATLCKMMIEQAPGQPSAPQEFQAKNSKKAKSEIDITGGFVTVMVPLPAESVRPETAEAPDAANVAHSLPAPVVAAMFASSTPPASLVADSSDVVVPPDGSRPTVLPKASYADSTAFKAKVALTPTETTGPTAEVATPVELMVTNTARPAVEFATPAEVMPTNTPSPPAEVAKPAEVIPTDIDSPAVELATPAEVVPTNIGRPAAATALRIELLPTIMAGRAAEIATPAVVMPTNMARIVSEVGALNDESQTTTFVAGHANIAAKPGLERIANDAPIAKAEDFAPAPPRGFDSLLRGPTGLPVVFEPLILSHATIEPLIVGQVATSPEPVVALREPDERDTTVSKATATSGTWTAIENDPSPVRHVEEARAPAALTDQVHQHLSAHLDQLRETGRVEVQIILHPPELGNVKLHLALNDSQLSVRFLVQNDGAKTALDQQLEPMRIRFAEMGFSLGQFDVRRDGTSSSWQAPFEPGVPEIQSATAPARAVSAAAARSSAMVDVLA